MAEQLSIDFTVPTEEEWRPVIGHPGYEVSNLGRVRSLDRMVLVTYEKKAQHFRQRKGQILTPVFVAGYPAVNVGAVSPAGSRHNSLVHILVCIAFHGPRPPGADAAHWDGDRTNARATNVRWATKSENNGIDKLRQGRQNRGTRNGSNRYSPEQIRQIREMLAAGVVQSRIAAHFRTTQQVISDIHRRKIWGWLE